MIKRNIFWLLLMILSACRSSSDRQIAVPFDTAFVLSEWSDYSELDSRQKDQLAKILRHQKQYREVIRLLKDNPSPERAQQIMESYFYLSKYDSALYYLSQVASLLKSDKEINMATAIYLNNNQPTKAREMALKLGTVSDDIQIMTARLSWRDGDTLQTRKIIREIAPDSLNEEDRYWLVGISNLIDREVTLPSLIASNLVRDPYIKVQYFYETGDLDSAFYEASSLDTPATFKWQTKIYLEQKNLYPATLTADLWVRYDSANIEALKTATEISMMRYRFYSARAYLTDWLKYDSSNVEAAEKLKTVNKNIRYLQRLEQEKDSVSNE